MVDLGELCSGRIPASRVVGCESGGARGPQGLEPHLQRGLVGLGVACNGLAAGANGSRRRCVVAGVLRRRVEGIAGLGSFSRVRARSGTA